MEQVTDDRREAGRALLRALDAIGLSPAGAAWVHDTKENVWFYILITTLVDERGAYWIYERLMKYFSKVPLPKEISPFDLHIHSPNELAIQALFGAFHVEDGEIDLKEVKIDNMEIDRMIIYRMVRPEFQAKSSSKAFDERINLLTAA